jgi:hypothetical protein
VGTAISVTVTVNNVATGSVPFQQRCAAAGVIKCEGFDDTVGLIPGVTMYPSFSDNQYHWSLDTSIKASGNSSLKFNVPAQISQDTSGHYNATLGGRFGPPESGAPDGTTFYVQFRERMDAAFVALRTDGEGWKQFGVHGGTTTCQAVGIVVQNIFWRGFPEGFTNCGGTGLTIGSGTSALLEQGDYNCPYSNQNATNCAFYKPDQWMTFYFKFVINHWDPPGTPLGQGSNTILGWVGYEGESLKQFFNLTNFPLNYQLGLSDVYDQVSLFVYDSRRTASQAYPVANVWYDELIVSTKPIPAPDGPTPPQ